MVVGWAGMRGAVSLAAALALPADFPARDQLLFITFGVIFATLVLQGLTLPAVIRWSGVHDDGSEAARGAARPPPRHRGRAGAPGRARGSSSGPATTPSSACAGSTATARAGSTPARRDRTTRATITSTARASTRRWSAPCSTRSARAVVELRNQGEISNDVMHRIERELDLEDERLEI